MFSPPGIACNATLWIQIGWGFLIFGLSSLLDPLKYFLPSFCSCVSCCLATFLCVVGRGRAPDRLWSGCQHHPLATRPGTVMLCKGLHTSQQPLSPLPLSHQALGESLLPPSLPTHTTTRRLWLVHNKQKHNPGLSDAVREFSCWLMPELPSGDN